MLRCCSRRTVRLVQALQGQREAATSAGNEEDGVLCETVSLRRRRTSLRLGAQSSPKNVKSRYVNATPIRASPIRGAAIPPSSAQIDAQFVCVAPSALSLDRISPRRDRRAQHRAKHGERTYAERSNVAPFVAANAPPPLQDAERVLPLFHSAPEAAREPEKPPHPAPQ